MKNKFFSSLIVIASIAVLLSGRSSAGVSRGGERNTNQGVGALHDNRDGNDNSGFGYHSLYMNVDGDSNTAVGSQALSNLMGIADSIGCTALGFQALTNNTSGDQNVGVGSTALTSNTTGIRNVAVGVGTLFLLDSGDSNTAIGGSVLSNSIVGNFNTGLGRRAIYRSRGDQNIGLGFFSGSNLTLGNNNLYISNVGPLAVGSESNTIRIGTQIATVATIGNPMMPAESHPIPAHTDTYIAGIFGAPTTGGVPVFVDGMGKLGTFPSSQRFKQEIEPMKDASEAIFSLRPVTFRYKKELDAKNTPQFGLVAEEVAKVDSDLVARDAKGEIYSVRYEAVNAMLLNEFIKQHRQVQDQQKQIDKLTAQLKEQAALIQKVSARIETSKSAPQVAANVR